jgi:dolichol-phosphate mannosyltransferase
LILLNLGILGVYVGRIYDQTKRRPLYVIDRIVCQAAAMRQMPSTSLLSKENGYT